MSTLFGPRLPPSLARSDCLSAAPAPPEIVDRQPTGCHLWEAFFLVPHHELVNPVLRLLARRVVGVEPRSDLSPELGLAVSAEAFAALTRPFDLGEVAVVRLEDVVVLGEDRANVRVRPEPTLLLDRRASAREGVHDLLLRLGLLVRGEDAGLRNRGRHFPGRSQEARKELVVDQGGFRITELRSHVSSDSEVRVLVDPARDKDGAVATGLP